MSKLLTDEQYTELVGRMNDRHVRFCEEYVKDLNGTQAAIRAGYAGRSAHNQAGRLIKNDDVMQLVAHLQAQLSIKVQYEAEELLSDLVEVLRNTKDKAMGQVDPEVLLAVGESADPAYLEQLKQVDPSMVNAFRNLAETVGKHINVQAYKERVDVNHTVDHAEAMEAAMRRAETVDRSKRLH